MQGKEDFHLTCTITLQQLRYTDSYGASRGKYLRKELQQCLKPSVLSSQHRPSQPRALSRSRNIIETHMSTGKSSSKHISTQKMPGSKRAKPRDSSQLNLKRSSVNIHTVRSNAFKGKEREKSLESAANKHSSNLQLGDDTIKMQIKNMLQLLGSKKMKEQSETPANQAKTLQKKLIAENKKNVLSGKHTPCAKSRTRNVQVSKTQENDSLNNRTIILRNVQCSFIKHNNPDQHKAKPTKSTTTKNVSKENARMVQEKIVRTKELRKKCIKENVENNNIEVNRANIVIEKVNLKEELEEVPAEDKQTVIEYDCENNYDLICKSLQTKYFQF